MTHYIIDGYNLLFRLFDHNKGFTQERQQMISLLSEYSQLLHLEMTIVFDAYAIHDDSLPSYVGNLRVVFTEEDQTADRWITEYVDEYPSPERLTIVSSDREVNHKAKMLGSKTSSAEAFMDKLQRRYGKKTSRKNRSILGDHKTTAVTPSLQQTYEELFSKRYENLVESDLCVGVKQARPISYTLQLVEDDLENQNSHQKNKKRKDKRAKPKETEEQAFERYLKIFSDMMKRED